MYRTPATPPTPTLSQSHSTSSGASSSSTTLAQLSNFSQTFHSDDSSSSPSTLYTTRLGQAYGYDSNYSLDGMIGAKMEDKRDEELLETYELFEGFGRKPKRGKSRSERSKEGDEEGERESPRRNPSRRRPDNARVDSTCSDNLQAARDLVARGTSPPSRRESIATVMDTWAPR